MEPDAIRWEALDPHRPLPGGDRRYLPRPWGGADRLVTLVKHRLTPIAVTGPGGTGKTTELAQALAQLDSDRVMALSIAVDQILSDVRDLTPPVLQYGIAQGIIDQYVLMERGEQPSDGLIKDLRASNPLFPARHGRQVPHAELVATCAREVERCLGVDRLVILLDGLDRAPPDVAHEAVAALLQIVVGLDLVVVVAPAVANGPDANELLSRMRVFEVSPVPVREVEGLPWQEGRKFLADLAMRRLGLFEMPPEIAPVIEAAAVASGGMVRTFLQLVHDAAGFASIEGRPWPTVADLQPAVTDLAEGMRRLLAAGDVRALGEADGTNGLEVPGDRRLRFLSQALLLQYGSGADTMVYVHPLLERIVRRSPADRVAQRAPGS
jgi:hypothetical protein